ncbi:MAG: hypothetical protein ACM3QU_04625 [Verrucomicrobiota bacterium]
MIERLFRRPGSRTRRRREEGERLGGYIYGEIVVLATIAAGAQAYKHGAGHIAVLVLATTAVFWLAHLYAHALADSIRRGEHLSWSELKEVAGRESSIIEAAVLPVLMLALGSIGIVSVHVAVWLAFLAGLIVLVTEGFAFARMERLGALATTGIVAANLVMGLLLVALKLGVSH